MYMKPELDDNYIWVILILLECDFKNGTLFLNPAEACGRNKSISECVLLETTHEYYNVTYYSKEENERDFNEQHFSFERV